ncbi:MAG: hypothetical protein GX339_06945 [Tissierellia bacterium]|nr:hypothetical protein [Tissierellia bacterium]
MDNFNANQNYNFSNNVRQFELNEAKKKMGIIQAQAQTQIPTIQQLNQQQLNQLNNQNQQEFNTLF